MAVYVCNWKHWCLGSIVTLRRAILCRYAVAIAMERVMLCSLLLSVLSFSSCGHNATSTRQRDTGRSVTIRRGIVTTGQIVLRLSCSVTFKNLFSLFVDVSQSNTPDDTVWHLAHGPWAVGDIRVPRPPSVSFIFETIFKRHDICVCPCYSRFVVGGDALPVMSRRGDGETLSFPFGKLPVEIRLAV